jgi:hypothetical protein
MKLVSAAAVGRILTPVLCLSVASPGLARAEDPAPAPTLDLEFNAMQPSDKGCRLTFLVKNDLASDLEKAAYEIVLFDKAGQVSRLVVLDFQNLPAGKTKVRQFDFAGTDCANIGRILVNDSTECKGAGVDPKACIDSLHTDTKAEVEFGL